jgi:hypothetical protein
MDDPVAYTDLLQGFEGPLPIFRPSTKAKTGKEDEDEEEDDMAEIWTNDNTNDNANDNVNDNANDNVNDNANDKAPNPGIDSANIDPSLSNPFTDVRLPEPHAEGKYSIDHTDASRKDDIDHTAAIRKDNIDHTAASREHDIDHTDDRVSSRGANAPFHVVGLDILPPYALGRVILSGCPYE